MRTLNIFLTLFSFISLSKGSISCKDEKNKNVDWFIVYKLPKIPDDSLDLISDGEAYAYLSSRKPIQWKLSSCKISSKDSMLGKTWQELKKKQKKASYLFYNDESPDGFVGSTVGHLKGYLAFDGESGFWLKHSIPKFGEIKKYKYPKSGLMYGQHAICVTFKTSQLNEIGKQLLYSHPFIYLTKRMPGVMSQLEEEAKSLFTTTPSFITSAPFQRQAQLVSAGHQKFFSFALDNQLAEDIFSYIIAPKLKTDLLTNTWRRGRGKFLPPVCEEKYSVLDVIDLNMTVSFKRGQKSIYFKSSEDHSKWAISTSSKGSWVCLADLNRMVSQAKRGGGAICFKSKDAWKAFKSIVRDTAICPI